jgi:flagellar hook-length control protein FliK
MAELNLISNLLANHALENKGEGAVESAAPPSPCGSETSVASFGPILAQFISALLSGVDKKTPGLERMVPVGYEATITAETGKPTDVSTHAESLLSADQQPSEVLLGEVLAQAVAQRFGTAEIAQALNHLVHPALQSSGPTPEPDPQKTATAGPDFNALLKAVLGKRMLLVKDSVAKEPLNEAVSPRSDEQSECEVPVPEQQTVEQTGNALTGRLLPAPQKVLNQTNLEKASPEEARSVENKPAKQGMSEVNSESGTGSETALAEMCAAFESDETAAPFQQAIVPPMEVQNRIEMKETQEDAEFSSHHPKHNELPLGIALPSNQKSSTTAPSIALSKIGPGPIPREAHSEAPSMSGMGAQIKPKSDSSKEATARSVAAFSQLFGSTVEEVTVGKKNLPKNDEKSKLTAVTEQMNTPAEEEGGHAVVPPSLKSPEPVHGRSVQGEVHATKVAAPILKEGFFEQTQPGAAKTANEATPVSTVSQKIDVGSANSRTHSKMASDDKSRDPESPVPSQSESGKVAKITDEMFELKIPGAATPLQEKAAQEIAKNQPVLTVPKVETRVDSQTPVQGKPVNLPPELLMNVHDQIAREVALKVSPNVSEIRIMLKPESLGTVTVHVRMEEGSMVARIDVNQPNVRTALEANLPQLRETLSGKGIQMDRIDVMASTFSSSRESSNPQHERPRPGLKRADDTEAVESYEAGRYLGYNTMDYLV